MAHQRLTIFLGLFIPGLMLACNPTIDSTRHQYIIGYGSLMNEASKEKTVKDKVHNHPVIVKGFRRGWYLNPCDNVVSYIATFLAATPSQDSLFNAVAFQPVFVKQVVA